jgi:hypothetical protein
VRADEHVWRLAAQMSPALRDLLDCIFVADEKERITLEVCWCVGVVCVCVCVCLCVCDVRCFVCCT